MKNNLQSSNLLLVSLHRKSLWNLYKKYVDKPVSIKILKNLNINKTALKHNDIRMWSVINTNENYKIWKNIHIDDIIIFLHDKKFFSKAKVIDTLEHDDKENRTENDVALGTKSNLLIFLEKITPIELDYDVCMQTLVNPQMPNAYFFPIMKISDAKKKLLISTFGNLENAVEFLANPEGKNSPISDYLTENKIMGETPYDIKTSLSKQRVGQQKFRKNILRNFYNTCAACKISDVVLLEAAHIIPINDKTLAGKINNGICFCSNCHKMFDNGFFSFDENYRIIISQHKKISNAVLAMLKNRKIKKSRILPSKEYLSLHRAKYNIKD